MKILKILFILLGVIEIATNGYYLISRKAATLGRKQHSELPEMVSDSEVIAKVQRMFGIGIIALIVGLLSVQFQTSVPLNVGAAIFVIITLYEAMKYKYWKIVSELALFTVLLVLTFVL
jgi:hypothetical protein